MKNHSIQLNYIKCINASEDNVTGGDEVYLDCQADAGLAVRFPQGANQSHQMEGGDVWYPGATDGKPTQPLKLNFQYEVLLTLWDHDVDDDPNTATFLVNHDIEPGTGSANLTLYNQDGAEYQLNYDHLN